MSSFRSDYNELCLVKDGMPNFTIVVSDKAGDKVHEAAQDLSDTIFKMSSGRAEIKTDKENLSGNLVLVGASRLTDEMGIPQLKGYPDGERIILRRIDDRLILVGNDDGAFTGTQFAVTAILERLGCGWFGPDELWQVIPEKKDISIGYLDIDHRPQFVSRKTNVLNFNKDIGMRWYQGGVPKVIGHALTKLIPREEYFKSHPEWFCMVDGKRNPFIEWWQYCYSNDELVSLFANKICSVFDSNPYMTQYSIAANDGWYHGWCECNSCAQMGDNNSERIIVFANKIAKKVAERYSDHTLTFLAYFPTYYPPKKKMKLQPNVEIMFCKETDMFSPVDKGPDNGYHIKYDFPHSKNSYLQPWKKNFEKWLEMVECRKTAIWDWYCIAAAYPEWKDVPWVQGDVIIRNQRYWHDHGVSYIYNDQGPNNVFFEDDRSYPLRWPLWYVNVKAMWDKDLTGSDILLDACKKLYGQLSDLMFAYYSCLADIARSCTARSIAWHPPKPSEVYTADMVERVDLILSAIKAMLPRAAQKVRPRIENQIGLWERAKEVIKAN